MCRERHRATRQSCELKTELLHRHRFSNREAARTAIFDYIEDFYNRQRGVTRRWVT